MPIGCNVSQQLRKSSRDLEALPEGASGLVAALSGPGGHRFAGYGLANRGREPYLL